MSSMSNQIEINSAEELELRSVEPEAITITN